MEKQNTVNVNIEKCDDIEDINKSAENAVKFLWENKLTFASAESCTGGLIGKLITDISGASQVYKGGIITYTNEIKINILGVDEKLISKYTEVSSHVACSMAENIKNKFSVNIGVSATGFAGPTGGNENDPVGTVYVGMACDEFTHVFRLSFFDGAKRDEIRLMTAKFIFDTMLKGCVGKMVK